MKECLGAKDMSVRLLGKNIKPVMIGLGTLAVLGLLILVAVQFHGSSFRLEDVIGNMMKKDEVVSEMKINLLKSVEAEKSAVLADTDEESQTFAEESIQASAAVDGGLHRLRLLVEEGGVADEKRILGEFESCWEKFKKIDQMLLELAVQNTNIKAVKLSYTQGSEAMSRFGQCLTKLSENSLSSARDGRIVELVLQALSAGHQIHYFQAPHIVTSSDERMDEIEADMKKAEGQVKTSLKALNDLVAEEGKPWLMEAKKAYAEFAIVNDEVIRLSRQNTNVKSLELSLGKKRRITAQCEEVLNALQEALRSKTFKATR
jgi:hypothetical protein